MTWLGSNRISAGAASNGFRFAEDDRSVYHDRRRDEPRAVCRQKTSVSSEYWELHAGHVLIGSWTSSKAER